MAQRSGGAGSGVRAREPIPRRAVAELLAGRFTHRLTIVCGPAGIGKSTTIELIREPRDVVIGCGPLDRSPERLFTRMLHALGHDHTGPLDADSLLERLADAVLVRAPTDVCIVLEDVHRMSDHGALDDLLDVLPNNGHLVVTTRTPPRMRIARLDAAGELLEIGMDDLRFSDEEVTEYARAHAVPVDLMAGLDGWPALLALAEHDGDRRIRRYVSEEVVDTLDASARRALASLTVIGDVSASDIESLLGWEPGPLLDGLPLVAVVDGVWRLHDLWSELLDGVLTGDDRRELIDRTVSYWRSIGEIDRALDLAAEHAMADAFTSTLRSELVRPTDQLDASRLAPWIEAAPPDARDDPVVVFARGLLARERDPAGVRCQQLLMDAADGFRRGGDVEAEVEALAHSGHPAYLRGDMAHLAALVERAGELADAGHTGLDGWLTLADALAALVAGDSRAVLALTRDVDPDALTTTWRGVCSFLEARSLLALGHASEALDAATAIGDVAVPGSAVVAGAARWATGEPDDALAAMSATAIDDRHRNQRDRFLLACHLAAMRSYTGDQDGARSALADATRALGTTATHIERVRLAHTELLFASICTPGTGSSAELARFARTHGGGHPGAEIVAHHLAWHLVNDPSLVEEWSDRATGPVHVEAIEIAGLLRAARDGVVTRSSWPSPGSVAAHLPVAAAAELAVAGLAGAHPSAEALATWLAEHWGGAARAALVHHADDEPSGRARARLRKVPAPPAHAVRLSVLGPVELCLDGEPSTSADWQRSRVRELAVFLAIRRRARREEVVDALWPHLDAAAGQQNLRRTLAYLNSVLEPDRPSGDASWFVRSDADSLVLHDSLGVDVRDVDLALAAAREAERHGDASTMAGALRDAIGRWRGPFADGSIDHEWADDAGRSYAGELARAGIRLAELSLAAGDAHGALDAARIVLRIDPWDRGAGELAGRAERRLAR